MTARQGDLLANDVALDDALADAAIRRRPGHQDRDDLRTIRRQVIRRFLASEGLPANRPSSGDEVADREDLSAGVAIPGGPGACTACGHALVKHEIRGRHHCEACTCSSYARHRAVAA
jgi:hypothetical protein